MLCRLRKSILIPMIVVFIVKIFLYRTGTNISAISMNIKKCKSLRLGRDKPHWCVHNKMFDKNTTSSFTQIFIHSLLTGTSRLPQVICKLSDELNSLPAPKENTKNAVKKRIQKS